MSYSTRTIDQLNNARPLSGDELLLVWQGDEAVKTSITDLQGNMANEVLAAVSASFSVELNNLNNEILAVSNELSGHENNFNNPHQVQLNQLKDVILNQLKDGDLIVYSESATAWQNENKITITDGGNF